MERCPHHHKEFDSDYGCPECIEEFIWLDGRCMFPELLDMKAIKLEEDVKLQYELGIVFETYGPNKE